MGRDGAISLVAAGGLFAANAINSVILEYFNFAAVWLVNSVIAAAPGASHCIDIIYPERWLILARFAVYPLCMMPYKAGGRINGTAVR